MSLYQRVTVASDINFFDIILFLISISPCLKFGAIERLKNFHVPTLVKAVHDIKKTYPMQVFNLAVIKIDPEFKPICSNLSEYNILLNVCVNNYHVPEEEWFICTAK